MKTLRNIFQGIMSLIFVVMQQAFVIGLGFAVFSQSGTFWGIFVWTLCIPMLYINYWTVKYIFRHGFFTFLSANSETWEIDVKREDRPFYHKDAD